MRLVMKLSAFPTTEAQDRAALGRNRNPIRDWRERMIVEFRMLRKQSLRLTGEAITAALQASQTTSAKASRRYMRIRSEPCNLHLCDWRFNSWFLAKNLCHTLCVCKSSVL